MLAARTLLDVLFASLWQDACVAICVAVVLALAGKRLNAATRHVVLQAALLVMIALPFVTTLSHVQSYQLSATGHGTTASTTSAVQSTPGTTLVRQIDVVL